MAPEGCGTGGAQRQGIPSEVPSSATGPVCRPSAGSQMGDSASLVTTMKGLPALDPMSTRRAERHGQLLSERPS